MYEDENEDDLAFMLMRRTSAAAGELDLETAEESKKSRLGMSGCFFTCCCSKLLLCCASRWTGFFRFGVMITELLVLLPPGGGPRLLVVEVVETVGEERDMNLLMIRAFLQSEGEEEPW